MAMPELSRFFGIVISIYRADHPPPHIHAWHGNYEIAVRIADGSITGAFPRHKQALVLEWCRLHKEELFENWNLAQEHRPPKRIEPLE